MSRAQTTGIQSVLHVMWTKARKAASHHGVVLKLMKEHRDEQDNQKRRQRRANAGT